MTGRGCPHSARFHYPLADGHGTACTACDDTHDAQLRDRYEDEIDDRTARSAAHVERAAS